MLFHSFLFHTGSTLQAGNKKKANTTFIRWSIGDDFDRYEEKISYITLWLFHVYTKKNASLTKDVQKYIDTNVVWEYFFSGTFAWSLTEGTYWVYRSVLYIILSSKYFLYIYFTQLNNIHTTWSKFSYNCHTILLKNVFC